MIDTDRMLAFAVTAFVIIVTPGPSVLFVLSRALAWGRKAAVATAVGNEAGLCLQVGAVAFGIGTVVGRSVLISTTLRLTGAVYLVYLGIGALANHRGPSTEAGRLGAGPPASRARNLRQGFVVGVSNPKTVVFFTAVLPGWVDRSRGHLPVQLLVLGGIFVAIALVCDSAWGVAAGSARGWFARSPRRLRVVGGAGGLVMIALGLDLVATGGKRS